MQEKKEILMDGVQMEEVAKLFSLFAELLWLKVLKVLGGEGGNFVKYSIQDLKLFTLCELMCGRVEEGIRMRLNPDCLG